MDLTSQQQTFGSVRWREETYNIHDTRVRPRNKGDKADNDTADIQGTESQIFRRRPRPLTDEHEPHDGREVEGKARDEERRGDGEEIGEERDDFCNDERDDGDHCDDGQPSDPTHGRVNEADLRVLPDPAVDETAQYDGVDGTADEDHGEGDPEGDTAHKVSGGKKRGTLHILADEAVDERAGERIDGNFCHAEGPDRLGEVRGSVHLVHEGELAHGETVREDDVGDGDEAVGESDALLWPGGPVHGAQSTGLLRVLNAGGDDGDADGCDDGGEVDEAEGGHLGETRGDGEEEEDDGRDDGEDDGADATFCDGLPCDRTRQGVRADEEKELQEEHDVDQLIPKTSHHQRPGVCVVLNLRES